MKIKGIENKNQENGKIEIDLNILFEDNDYKNTKLKLENPGLKVVLTEEGINDIFIVENEKINNNYRLWPYEQKIVEKYLQKEGLL